MWRTVVLLMLALLLACNRRVPPVEISLLWQRDYLYIAPADVNGDSTDEFVTISRNGVLDRLGSDMRTSGKTAWIDRGVFASKSVAGESKEAGIWYTHVRHDSLFLFSSLASRDLLITSGRGSLPPAGWDGLALGVTLLDFNNDGQLDAVVEVTSGYDARPRGMYAIDYTTGVTRWTFPTGPAVEEPTFRDIDGDSQVEVLFGSAACRNGNSSNGTTDDSTYVFLLNCDGRPRWVRRIGKYSSIAHAAFDMSSNGLASRVVVYETGSEEDSRAGDSAFILDSRTGEILARRRYGKYTSCGAAVRCPSGRIHIVLGGSDDTLRIIDDSLRLVRSTGIRDGVRQVIAGSFSGRGQDELAVLTNNGRLLLLDTLLRLRAVKPCSTTAIRVAFQRVRYAGKDRLLVLNSNGNERTWLLYDFTPVPLLQRRVPLALVLVGLGFLLASFVAVLLLLRYRQTRDTRTLVRSLTGQAGILEIDNRGRIRHVNPKGRELLGGEAIPPGPLAQAVKAALVEPSGSQPKELPVVLDSGKTVLARAARVRSGVMLTLEDISTVEYLKRVSTWVPVAQKLAHDIKNPLTAISLTLQRVEKAAGPDSQRYVDSMKDDIDRLKKMADGFMRLTKLEPPKLAPEYINEVVRQCAGKFEGVKPAGVEFRYDLADSLPSVALDRDQMAVACTNIIENSISAMGDSGTLTVSTFLADSGKRIAVSVRDTGKGIPERYLAKVLEPYFTLKPGGTGLGMALTRRIIEDHKGAIRIESKEGIGTTVTIELPAAGTGRA